MDRVIEGPHGQRVVTISGLRIEVTRFGQLKIGHRIMEADEGDQVSETLKVMSDYARHVKDARRKPRRERGL